MEGWVRNSETSLLLSVEVPLIVKVPFLPVSFRETSRKERQTPQTTVTNTTILITRQQILKWASLIVTMSPPDTTRVTGRGRVLGGDP